MVLWPNNIWIRCNRKESFFLPLCMPSRNIFGFYTSLMMNWVQDNFCKLKDDNLSKKHQTWKKIGWILLAVNNLPILPNFKLIYNHFHIFSSSMRLRNRKSVLKINGLSDKVIGGQDSCRGKYVHIFFLLKILPGHN